MTKKLVFSLCFWAIPPHSSYIQKPRNIRVKMIFWISHQKIRIFDIKCLALPFLHRFHHCFGKYMVASWRRLPWEFFHSNLKVFFNINRSKKYIRQNGNIEKYICRYIIYVKWSILWHEFNTGFSGFFLEWKSISFLTLFATTSSESEQKPCLKERTEGVKLG